MAGVKYLKTVNGDIISHVYETSSIKDIRDDRFLAFFFYISLVPTFVAGVGEELWELGAEDPGLAGRLVPTLRAHEAPKENPQFQNVHNSYLDLI